MSAFFNRFKKDISGVAWLALGLFLSLSLLSFNPLDPSFNSAGTASAVSNYCGLVGSFLSDLLFQVFGVAAWLIVAAALKLSMTSFREGETRPTRNALVVALLLIANLASLVALYLPETKMYHGEVPVGGLLGAVLSQALVKIFNKIGVALILWSAIVMFVIYYTQKSLKEVFEKPVQRLRILWSLFEKRAIEPLRSVLWSYLSSVRLQSSSASAGASPARFVPVEDPDILRQSEGDEEPEREAHFVIDDSATETQERREAKKAVVKRLARRVENWELPKVSLLEDAPSGNFRVDQTLIMRNTQLLEDKLAQFNVKGQVVAVRPGPAVTLFEFKPNADVKISRITELADDLSLALSAESVRIIAPMPGRDVVGIETSNPRRETVFLKDVLEDSNFWDEKVKLPLALGKQANGETKVVDLRKMPHLLVAGTTGSGKSVFVVSALTGLLFRHSPKSLRLILIDPKQVDLAAFHKVPHLLMPPIREPKKAVTALKWAIREMEKRYRSMSRFGARGLEAYNEIIEGLKKNELERHEQDIAILEESAPHETYYASTLPYIVVVVEEFGDLMAVDKNNVEHSVVRLAQMARACGIHLILAMQSPRKDVVTGLIKTNIPGRISFKVASKMDSRIILDDSGAERLLANGDMLYQAPGIAKPERHHGAWVTEKEICLITKMWSDQDEPDFDKNAMKMLEGSGGGYDFADDGGQAGGGEEDHDEMYDQILAEIAGLKEISASLLQRKYRLGYPRAARMIEIFEREGVVGPANGSKPRQVLVNKL